MPKKFIKETCAPNKKNNNNFTCYSEESLLKMKKLWNKKHPDIYIQSDNPRDIWNNLKFLMNNTCNKESCWLKQEFIKHNLDKNLLNYTFAPNSPSSWKSNPNQWLTSLDIIKVMKQYEHTYPYFSFIGPSPIDYDSKDSYSNDICVWNELCHFNLLDFYKRNKCKIGIIFNLDIHTLPGSHWVALFIDTKKKYIYYFDSTGHSIPPQIKKLTNIIKKQASDIKEKYTLKINNIQHQTGDSECGVYCLFFIIEMLKNKDFKYFLNERISDETIEKFRNIYFNNH